MNRHDRKDRGILSPLRLPVSPLRRRAWIIQGGWNCQEKCIDNDGIPVLLGASLHEIRHSRGCSSVGRALEWHSRGRRFDPDQLHQEIQGVNQLRVSPFFFHATLYTTLPFLIFIHIAVIQ